MKMLLFGIGNSGRSDDGLGWKFVENIEQYGYDFIDCDFRYQLQIEDAALVSKYDVVVFVDASEEKLENGFQIRTCVASDHYYYSTHAQDPGAILHLCNTLFNKFPESYILAISGLQWDLCTSLSEDAKCHLIKAISFFTYDFLPAFVPKLIFA